MLDRATKQWNKLNKSSGVYNKYGKIGKSVKGPFKGTKVVNTESGPKLISTKTGTQIQHFSTKAKGSK